MYYNNYFGQQQFIPNQQFGANFGGFGWGGFPQQQNYANFAQQAYITQQQQQMLQYPFNAVPNAQYFYPNQQVSAVNSQPNSAQKSSEVQSSAIKVAPRISITQEKTTENHFIKILDLWPEGADIVESPVYEKQEAKVEAKDLSDSHTTGLEERSVRIHAEEMPSMLSGSDRPAISIQEYEVTEEVDGVLESIEEPKRSLQEDLTIRIEEHNEEESASGIEEEADLPSGIFRLKSSETITSEAEVVWIEMKEIRKVVVEEENVEQEPVQVPEPELEPVVVVEEQICPAVAVVDEIGEAAEAIPCAASVSEEVEEQEIQCEPVAVIVEENVAAAAVFLEEVYEVAAAAAAATEEASASATLECEGSVPAAAAFEDEGGFLSLDIAVFN
eukprot:TRINITY_DN418_c0_g1_i1.p1 TRINITY_DN418_c0_g1~~TRINITY_DN418_c0_g1_i1.p1  ORF type:complete len:387 (+),score=141.73 TRINITY_DN418_c0_g1_i1:145-1305(+)